MAEAEGTGAGYEYTFVDTVPGSLNCLICQNPARHPHQLTCCGRVFCKACLEKHNEGRRARAACCPHCRSTTGVGFIDKRSERDILGLQVKCVHSEKGCTWVGELRKMDEHAKQCSEGVIPCPFSSIGCSAGLFARNLEEHMSTSVVSHLALAVEEMRFLDERQNLPPVVFRMCDFQDYELSGQEWNSPPFYTHSKGYKLYLNVCILNLQRTISVLVCLMHGEFDEDLVWPFRGTISFELLNQNADSDHKEGKASFMEAGFSQKNDKVSASEVKRNVGWGEDLSYDTENDEAVNCQYVSDDDDVYFRISQTTVSDWNKPWLI